MHLEEFAEGTSFLHRLDPRVKFISVMPYIFVIAFIQGLRGPFLALMVSLSMIGLSRISFKKVIGRIIVVNAFILFLWIFLPFSYPGEAVFNIGPLKATYEGFLYTFSITLKANAIVLTTIAVFGTTKVFSLAHALVHLKVPNKLIHLFFFFYRYISVLHEEYTRLKNAMTIRCFRPKTNMHTYRTYAYLIGMLIVKSYDRSRRIYNAMVCRGFSGKFPIVSHFEFKKVDLFFGFFIIVITFTLAII
ncbi:MAG: cobalt ECF transporter T component CbiQ [Nitrospirae bacterium]|nr:cobalt ECF transporter T component CbiQ [Nitrospirota bacterium]